MELNTIAECDVALHCFDLLLGEHTREFDEALKIADEHNNKAAIALKQRNVVRNEMDAIEQRKKELCGTNQMESKSNNANSSLFQSVGAVVEDCVQAIQNNTSAEVAKTLND